MMNPLRVNLGGFFIIGVYYRLIHSSLFMDSIFHKSLLLGI